MLSLIWETILKKQDLQENNFYYAKIIYDQEKIPQKVKDEVILDCANKLFSETENLHKISTEIF